MLKLMAVHVEHLQHKLVAFGRYDVKNVDFDKLAHEVTSLFGRNLQHIHSKA